MKLKLVIAALEKVPDKAFDIEYWKCDTTACAIGHYILQNPDCGLSFKESHTWPTITATITDQEGSIGLKALIKHFDLPEDELYDLFIEPEDCSRLGVIEALKAKITKLEAQ